MKKAFTLFAILSVLLLAGCAQVAQKQGAGKNADADNPAVKIAPDNAGNGGDDLAGQKNSEKANFRTVDGFTISGNLSRGGKRAVVLMHQYALDKSSYNSLAKKLNDANFTVLAIDLRGHGESLDKNGVKVGYASFPDREFRDMAKDVSAAKKFLQQQGFPLYALVGSSIGANTAVTYAAQDSSVEKIVLLSPGMNFKGIDTEAPSRNVKAKTLIVASDDDAYSFGSGKALQKNIAGSEFMGLQRAGHGTNMFRGTLLENDIVKWLG